MFLAPIPANTQRATHSKYVDPAMYDGLFYVMSGNWRNDWRSLVISYNDGPIEPKANDPDAPTIPGFYPSSGKRFDFEYVEVIRKKVTFQTRTIDGVSYAFSGRSGQEIVQGFDPRTLVPFIKRIIDYNKAGENRKKRETEVWPCRHCIA